MTSTFFSGYLGLGTDTTSFVEQTGTGYVRRAATFVNAGSRRTSNSAAVTFTATDDNWDVVTQFGIFADLVNPTPLIWWNKAIPVSVAKNAHLTVAANSFSLLLSDNIYETGVLATWSAGDVIGYDAGNKPLTVGYPFSAGNGVAALDHKSAGSGSRIGMISAANMNATADKAFTMFGGAKGGKFIIRKITATNPSRSLTTAVGGIYPAASKGGTPIVAATQAYDGLTGSGTFLDLTLEAAAATTVYSSAPYLSLSTAQGVAATADIHLFGDIVG